MPEETSDYSLLRHDLLRWVRDHILLVVVLLIVALNLSKRYVSPLRKYPGPFLASFSKLWRLWIVSRGHCEHSYMDLHQKYGNVVRTAPNEISFSSATAAKDILAVGKGVQKTDFYWVFPPAENPDVFTEIREWKHAQLKRFVVQPYSLNSMQKMTPVIQDVVDELIQKLDKFAESEHSICDLGNYLHWFAFDVLGEIAFSHRYGFVRTGTDVENCIQYIDDVQYYNGLVGQMPWLHYLLRLNPLARYIPQLGLKNVFITRMALGEIQKRKEIGNDGKLEGGQNDLLAQLLQAHTRSPDKFSEFDVFSVTHGAIGAGADSTASTMQSFFWLLLNNPLVYRKLLAELDEAQVSGKLSPTVTYAEAQDLPYFQACLNEAMRLRPAVGLNIYRKLPPGGLSIDSIHYPGGTEVAVNGWVIHRDKTIFGEDAEDYRPERWLESNAKEMHRHMCQFGGGSHLCLGRNVALLEMNKLLPQLLRRYRLKLVHPGRRLQHRSNFFVVQTGLEVHVSLRNATGL